MRKNWHGETEDIVKIKNLEFDSHKGEVEKEFSGWNSRHEKFKVLSSRKAVHLGDKFTVFLKTVP